MKNVDTDYAVPLKGDTAPNHLLKNRYMIIVINKDKVKLILLRINI